MKPIILVLAFVCAILCYMSYTQHRRIVALESLPKESQPDPEQVEPIVNSAQQEDVPAATLLPKLEKLSTNISVRYRSGMSPKADLLTIALYIENLKLSQGDGSVEKAESLWHELIKLRTHEYQAGSCSLNELLAAYRLTPPKEKRVNQ